MGNFTALEPVSGRIWSVTGTVLGLVRLIVGVKAGNELKPDLDLFGRDDGVKPGGGLWLDLDLSAAGAGL